MVHRGIATLSAALMICFLLLSHFDPQFFLIHFYESMIYLAIIVMLFYFEDRWAYMLGMVAPTIWLVLIFILGVMPGMLRQVSRVVHLRHPDLMANLVGAIIVVLSVLMIGFCAHRWRREFAGSRKGLSTLAISAAVAAVYYSVIVVWVLRWPPGAS
jgi:hypothetical protein